MVNGKPPPTPTRPTNSAKPSQPGASSSSSSSGGPSAGLRVLLQNAGSFLFDDFTDDREDCLTRSIRIQAALVLLGLAEKTKLGQTGSPAKKMRLINPEGEEVAKLLLRHEHRISLIAASRQDASPVLARLLSYLPWDKKTSEDQQMSAQIMTCFAVMLSYLHIDNITKIHSTKHSPSLPCFTKGFFSQRKFIKSTFWI